MAAPSISTYILSNSSHYYGSEGGAAVMTSPSDSVTKVSAIISQTSGGAAIETVETTVKTSSDLYADRWALTWPTAGITASPYYVRMWATNSDGDGAVREVAPYIFFPPSVSVTSPANGSTLTDSSVTMAWTASDDYGISYQRASVSHDGTELWGAEVEGTSIAVPSSVVFEDGESYTFSVTARNGKGMESTATNTASFSFVAPSVPALEITEGDGKSASITVTDSSYTESGTVLEASSAMMDSLTIQGKSQQNGTPTPSAPVPIRSVESGNLTEFFAHDLADTAYWGTVPPAQYFTQLSDGWAHVEIDNTGGSSQVIAIYSTKPIGSILPSTGYTMMLELRNVMSVKGSSNTIMPWNNANNQLNISNQYPSLATQTADYLKYTYAATSSATPSSATLLQSGYARVYPGGSLSCDIRLSLYEGSYDGEYMPTGAVLLRTKGRNLLDINSPIFSANLATYSISGESATVTATAASGWRYVRWKLPFGGASATLSIQSMTAGGMALLQLLNSGGTATASVQLASAGSVSASADDAVSAYVILYASSSSTGSASDTATYTGIQLELGDTATAYEPYSSTTTPIPVTLRSLPDGTHDEWISGETEDTLIQRVGEVTYDGSESWTLYTSSSYGEDYYTARPAGCEYPLYGNGIASTIAPGSSVNSSQRDKVNVSSSGNINFAVGRTLNITTVDSWKAYLAANPVTVIYKLATPVTTTYPHATLPYVDGSAWVDAEVTPNIEATFRPVDFPDQPAADSVDVVRVNADGSTWTVASGLSVGDTAIDPLPPLGVDTVYKAIGKTSAGGMSEKLFMHEIPTTGWVLNFGDAAQEAVGFIYNPQATMTLAQGGESYHFADGGMGGGFPVFYPTTDRDASGTLAFDTVLYGDSDRLLDLCRRYPVAWLRDPFGHRWRAHVRPSVSHGVGQVWPVTIAWDAVRFEEV